MRLESALNTSKEGLNAHGQAIAIIGDNISNVSTTAYKTSRAEFSDILGEAAGDRVSETVAGAGDGVSVSRVRVLHETGVIEPTGRELDVGISGGGFFMVGDVASPEYTRSGAFEISRDGLLTNASGQPILGFSGADTTALGTINMYNVRTVGAVTTKADIFGNLDAGARVTQVPANVENFTDLSRAESYSAVQDVFDSQGTRHTVRISFFKTAPNKWTAQAYIDGGEVTGGTAGKPQLIGKADLTFDGNGVITDANKAAAVITGAANYSNGAAAGNFTVNLGTMSQYAGGSLVTNVTQDGQSPGQVTAYEFSPDGKIFAVLDNGIRSQIGALPLATFRNLDGLERSGSGTFVRTEKAGDPIIGAAGNGLRGDIEGRTLERSTVDIAEQFVNLVLIQRGYQANSQVLGAANEMIQGTLQLIR
jgi:flagellar hook protein FlgE